MSDSHSSRTQFWNRVQLIMIAVVFLAPIIGAFLYKPSKFSHYGDLYQPVRPISNLQMQGRERLVEMDSLRRQWVFLVIANGSCEQPCEDNILKMRQLRFMQNNDMSRIRTVFLHAGLNTSKADDLAAKYHPIEAYSVNPQQYATWTQQLLLDNVPKEAQRDRFYVIDPAGNLMMSYPSTADPNIMKKDIKRLLKTSQIG